MWTFTDDYNLLPNLYIRSHFKDGELRFFQIYPCDGFVIHIKYLDTYLYDEETGEPIFDENGDLIMLPYYHGGGASVVKTYDWLTNPNGYTAEKYEKNMTVC